MKILSLGTEVSALNGGLPEYLRYFANVFGQTNEIVFLSISLHDIGQDYQINTFSPNVKEIVVNVPDFFQPSMGGDVFKYPIMCKAFELAIQAMQPDIIICHDWFWAPVLMSFPIQVPVIFMVHFFYTFFNRRLGFSNPIQELSERHLCFDLSWRVVANSEATMNDILSVYPEIEPKVLAAPLGVDLQAYQPVPNLQSKVITYIGRLQGEKGIDPFLRNVKANLPALKANGYELWVAGKGSYLEMVVDMSMAGDIKYLGVIGDEQKHQVLSQAKYQVFPSIYEPWGLSLNEALASGKICIASPAGGHVEQIKDGSNGFLVPDNQFIEKIFEIEKNPKLQQKVVEKASSSAFDIRNHFALLGRIMDECVRSYQPTSE